MTNYVNLSFPFFSPLFYFVSYSKQIGKMTEFVRVKLMQVDFGAQSPARDPYCAVSIKEAVADSGKLSTLFAS